MSQKKAKLMRNFLVFTGLDKTGQQWNTESNVMDRKGNLIPTLHTLRDDKKFKKAYSAASASEKSKMTRDFKAVCVKLPS